MSVRPEKIQISLGSHPVWSESSLSAWRKLGPLATHWAHREDSDQMDFQAVLSLHWAHTHFVCFVTRRLESERVFIIWGSMNIICIRCCELRTLMRDSTMSCVIVKRTAVRHYQYMRRHNDCCQVHVCHTSIWHTFYTFKVWKFVYP